MENWSVIAQIGMKFLVIYQTGHPMDPNLQSDPNILERIAFTVATLRVVVVILT